MRLFLTILGFELRRQLLSWPTLWMIVHLVSLGWVYNVGGSYYTDLGAGVMPYNASFLIYTMTNLNSFWLNLFTAHIMSAALLSDANVRFAEIHLSAPVGPRTFLLGKYVGGLITSLAVASACSLSLASLPLLAVVGIIPASSVAPTPWAHIGHAFGLLLLPFIFTLGTTCFVVTARTGRAGASYAVAGVFIATGLMCEWLYFGDVTRRLAMMLDPTGYFATFNQILSWSAEQRRHAFFELRGPYRTNRIGMVVLGLLMLGLGLVRPNLTALWQSVSTLGQRRVSTSRAESASTRAWTLAAGGPIRWTARPGARSC